MHAALTRSVETAIIVANRASSRATASCMRTVMLTNVTYQHTATVAALPATRVALPEGSAMPILHPSGTINQLCAAPSTTELALSAKGQWLLPPLSLCH